MLFKNLSDCTFTFNTTYQGSSTKGLKNGNITLDYGLQKNFLTINQDPFGHDSQSNIGEVNAHNAFHNYLLRLLFTFNLLLS